MKKELFLTIFILFTFTGFSQSFIDTTKHWNVATCGWSIGQICDTYSYKFSGDTIINSINYKKLYYKLDSTLNNWSFNSALREDGNRVFIYTTGGDKLLYDFDAVPGDTIKPYIINLFHPMIVDSVDTVLINGVPKKRILFYTSFNWYYETWIEDIGSINGLVNPLLRTDMLIVDYSETTLCYWKDNNLVYFDSTWNTCYLNTTSITEHDSKINLQLYPNPSGNKINLNFMLKTSAEIKIQILNITGQEVFSISEKNYSAGENKIDISVSYLPNGIYFLKFYVDGRLVTKKFLKN